MVDGREAALGFPSHGIGIRDYVEPVAMAAAVAGADGVIFEIHSKPEEAYSDGQQTLDFGEILLGLKLNTMRAPERLLGG